MSGAMQGLRCPSCGETRWHLMPIKLAAMQTCAMCGTEMVPERRWPGRGPRRLVAERRKAATPPPAAPV
jgi:uncharacterized protein (DUF983 family)